MPDDPLPATFASPSDGIALCRLSGPRASLQAAVDEIAAVLVAARDGGVRRLALDITGISGFAAPTLAERHALIRKWAEAAGGRLVVALASPVELIDRERFGVVAAANFGLPANVFANTDDAIAWLRST